MGHRDFACAVHTPYVDAMHDALHDSVPDVSPMQALRDVQAVLRSETDTAFGYSREAWVEALLNMYEVELGQMLAALLDPERDMPTIQRFAILLWAKAWRVASNTEEI